MEETILFFDRRVSEKTKKKTRRTTAGRTGEQAEIRWRSGRSERAREIFLLQQQLHLCIKILKKNEEEERKQSSKRNFCKTASNRVNVFSFIFFF